MSAGRSIAPTRALLRRWQRQKLKASLSTPLLDLDIDPAIADGAELSKVRRLVRVLRFDFRFPLSLSLFVVNNRCQDV